MADAWRRWMGARMIAQAECAADLWQLGYPALASIHRAELMRLAWRTAERGVIVHTPF